MAFGNNRKIRQQQDLARRRHQNDLIELEDTLGDIADEMGL